MVSMFLLISSECLFSTHEPVFLLNVGKSRVTLFKTLLISLGVKAQSLAKASSSYMMKYL